jgi:hypothetical protein
MAKIKWDTKAGNKGYAESGGPTEYLAYLYDVSDLDWVAQQVFEVSTAFEAKASAKSKGKNDWWNYDIRFEAWNWKDDIDTKANATIAKGANCATAATNWVAITDKCDDDL